MKLHIHQILFHCCLAKPVLMRYHKNHDLLSGPLVVHPWTSFGSSRLRQTSHGPQARTSGRHSLVLVKLSPFWLLFLPPPHLDSSSFLSTSPVSFTLILMRHQNLPHSEGFICGLLEDKQCWYAAVPTGELTPDLWPLLSTRIWVWCGLPDPPGRFCWGRLTALHVLRADSVHRERVFSRPCLLLEKHSICCGSLWRVQPVLLKVGQIVMKAAAARRC